MENSRSRPSDEPVEPEDLDTNTLLNELHLLFTMYEPDAFQFDDPELEAYLKTSPYDDPDLTSAGLSKSIISASFTLRLPDTQLELSFRLPEGYPKTQRLSASIRALGNVSDVIRTRLNKDLQTFILSSSSTDESSVLTSVDIFSVISFCMQELDQPGVGDLSYENAAGDQAYQGSQSGTNSSRSGPGPETLSRLWIYSHHIYNKHKRKVISDEANCSGLTGFFLSGKPGFICVEGNETDCDEFWTRIRQLNWQKITLIEKEKLKKSSKSQLKSGSTESTRDPSNPVFSDKGFEELSIDKASFIKYLEELQISHIIKKYLGI